MKLFFSQNLREDLPIEEELTKPNLEEDIKKTRYALENAYTGFDNAVEPDLIDCYIFEINALSKRYNHLLELSALERAAAERAGTAQKAKKERLRQKSPIRALVSHVFG